MLVPDLIEDPEDAPEDDVIDAELVEDLDDEPQDAVGPAGELVTLREAWTEGTVGGEFETLRKAAKRPGFPPHAAEGARGAYLYRRDALAGWWGEKLARADAELVR